MHWHALWLVASFGLAFGINAQMKPSVDFPGSAADTSVGSGHLELTISGRTQTYELLDIRVLAKDLDRTFGPVVEVRELVLRSPADGPDVPPDLELYVDFAAPKISPNARDVELLRGRELPVLQRPIGRDVRSVLRLPAGTVHAEVVSGTFVITDAISVSSTDGSAAFRIGGRIDLQLRDADEVYNLSGPVKARLRW